MIATVTVEAPILGSVNEVARRLAVSPKTIYRLNDRGHLPQPVRIGGKILWNLETIRAWVEQGCPKTSSI